MPQPINPAATNVTAMISASESVNGTNAWSTTWSMSAHTQALSKYNPTKAGHNGNRGYSKRAATVIAASTTPQASNTHFDEFGSSTSNRLAYSRAGMAAISRQGLTRSSDVIAGSFGW